MYRQKVFKPSYPEICLQVNEIFSTYSYSYSPKFKFEGESHDSWELIYTNTGEVIVETPEYNKVLSKGHVFLHLPNEPHKIRANNVACNMYIISFKCDCPLLFEIAQRPIPIQSRLKNYIFNIVEEGKIFLAGKNSIKISPKQPQYASGQMIKNLIELLLIELIRNSKDQTEANSDETATTLLESTITDKIIEYMKENVQNKLKLEDIAVYMSYSVARICAIFKKTMGTTILNYFTHMRIQKAKQLMAKSDMSLRQISEYLNFDSPQYFSMQFKKVVGQTPSQYVALLKNTNYNMEIIESLEFLE